MMSIAQVRSAGSAGNYYTDKDNYYVLGSMGERWAGRGLNSWDCRAVSIRMFFYPSSGGKAAGRSGSKPHAGWQ
nr:hypothetical protein [Escherichia coli]